MLDKAIELFELEDYEDSYKIFKEYAQTNRSSGEAPYYLGLFYYHGYYVNCDIEQAKQWWKRAKKNGSIDADFMLQSIDQSTICKC